MIYYFDVTENVDIFFDISYLNEGEQIEFELNLYQGNNVFNINFPDNFVWSSLSQSNLDSNNTTYSISIRYKSGKFYGKMIAIYSENK